MLVEIKTSRSQKVDFEKDVFWKGSKDELIIKIILELWK